LLHIRIIINHSADTERTEKVKSVLIASLAYINNIYYLNAGISLLLLVNFVGLFFSGLLLLKQIRIQSDYADRICSLFKQKDCNNVLESKAANLFGAISWSEIGFGYFLANILLLLIFPAPTAAIALLNLLTLPFTLWSVWYQRFKAKQWCMLCLIIVALLWTVFLINCLFGYINCPFEGGRGMSGMLGMSEGYLVISQFVLAIGCYIISMLGANLLTPKLNSDRTNQYLKQAINSLKVDEDIFRALLKKQPFYETNDSDSIIRFGNPASKLRLTILSNPYCNPCSAIHKRIEAFLKMVNNEVSVQIILSSFEEKLNSINKYLIASCLMALTTNHLPITTIFSDWFEKGRQLGDEYFKDKNLDIEQTAVEAEFQKHEAWKQKTQLKATPTVLVNGYKLPDNYKIEDLRFFTELTV